MQCFSSISVAILGNSQIYLFVCPQTIKKILPFLLCLCLRCPGSHVRHNDAITSTRRRPAKFLFLKPALVLALPRFTRTFSYAFTYVEPSHNRGELLSMYARPKTKRYETVESEYKNFCQTNTPHIFFLFRFLTAKGNSPLFRTIEMNSKSYPIKLFISPR